MSVWLAGEGNNELGIDDALGRRTGGALEALLRRVRADGWTREGSSVWARIQKYRVRGATERHADFFNVAGLALYASDKRCNVLAFVRDEDGDENREEAVRAALAWVRENLAIEVIGGVAKPALEGWILAMRGHRKTDELSRSKCKEHLEAAGVVLKDTRGYVAVIEAAELETLPEGCESLGRWLARARELLNV
ncbi:MAG TPA: hypothetical protein VGM88_34075 [Kofleriaceae bacterium]